MTRYENQDMVGTSIEELSGDWRAAHKRKLQHPERRVVTHEVGQIIKEAGFEGIKYYSAYDISRWNIVIFTENLHEENQVIFNLPDAAHLAIDTLNNATGENE